MRKLYEIFKLSWIQKRIVAASTIWGYTVIFFLILFRGDEKNHNKYSTLFLIFDMIHTWKDWDFKDFPKEIVLYRQLDSFFLSNSSSWYNLIRITFYFLNGRGKVVKKLEWYLSSKLACRYNLSLYMIAIKYQVSSGMYITRQTLWTSSLLTCSSH